MASAAVAEAGQGQRPDYRSGEVPEVAPHVRTTTPSPGTSSPSSPIRDYIYRPPADAGSVRDRLVPPSTLRPGPRGFQ
ncbi:MAG: hypothetical protein AB7L18_08805 [Hyphomicrobiaceae bacterium]